MNDGDDRHEEVGSVADEAAKLLEALQGWVHTGAEEEAPGAGSAARHGSEGDCRWCPLCRAAAVVRQTSPEVRDHLAEAATSLLSAGAAFLEARRAAAEAQAAGTPAEEPDPGVEHIDLDADDAWDAD